MNLVVPWTELTGLIHPSAPASKTGHPTFPIATMLRIHFMHQWFGLSDLGMEEALHDMALFLEFAQLEEGAKHLPDESTILRLLLPFAKLIATTRSTKNNSDECDPEMR
jgi:IS5 family transposase